MIIGIFGATQSGHYLAQLLDKNDKVSKIFHYQTSADEKFYRGMTKYESVLNGDLSYMVQTVMSCDLLITMGTNSQLNDKLQELFSKAKGKKLVPSKYCSMLEDSKILSKSIFKKLGIRTPDYNVVSYDQLINDFFNYKRPFVLKYDQDFRAGRQTLIVNDSNVDDIFNEIKLHGRKKFGRPEENDRFIVEDYLVGKEHSLHILADGLNWCYLGSARDYKKELDGDSGNNVTSMGCYSPAGTLSEDMKNFVTDLLRHLYDNGTPYKGIMYLGVLTDAENNDHILELNARPGNPEFIAVLNSIENDILDVLLADDPSKIDIKFKKTACLNIQLHNTVSVYNKEITQEIDITNLPSDITVSYSNFFGLMPAAGLTIVADNLEIASNRLYEYLEQLNLNVRYRKDIGRLI